MFLVIKHDFESSVYSTENPGLVVYVMDDFGTLVPLDENFESLWYSMYESMDHSDIWPPFDCVNTKRRR